MKDYLIIPVKDVYRYSESETLNEAVEWANSKTLKSAEPHIVVQVKGITSVNVLWRDKSETSEESQSQT